MQISFIALTNAYAVIMAPFMQPLLLLPIALPLWVLIAAVSYPLSYITPYPFLIWVLMVATLGGFILKDRLRALCTNSYSFQGPIRRCQSMLSVPYCSKSSYILPVSLALIIPSPLSPVTTTFIPCYPLCPIFCHM